jgi:hypothetical protein
MNKSGQMDFSGDQTGFQSIPLLRAEEALGSVFCRVEPSPDFISTLQTRFDDPESIRPFRRLSPRDIILLVFTLISALMLGLTLIKLTIDLFSSFSKNLKSSPKHQSKCSRI